MTGRKSVQRSSVAAAPSQERRTIADPLSDVLSTLRLTGACFFMVRASPPWVSEVPDAASIAPILLPRAQQLISYHIVTEGPMWGGLVDEPPRRLRTGDVLLIPHGDAHVMSSRPGMRSADPVAEAQSFLRDLVDGRLPPLIEEGDGGGGGLGVMCGFLGCDAHPFNPALATLPRLVHLSRPAAAGDDSLERLIEVVRAESASDRPGARCMLVRLGELLFVEVVRRYVSALPAEETGWLMALRDPVVGRALALLHQRPAEAWTLEALAREAGASRSTLADRFTRMIGQPPGHYLTGWRMQLAARLLRDRQTKVYAVAREVGYESEAAFSRAFKRIVGTPPAAWQQGA